MDVFAGEHRQPAFLELNPNGMIPVLDDMGYILWEANAIAQYLASTRPGDNLLPEAGRLRADVSRWQCWDLAHWTPAANTLAFERVFKKLAGLGEPDAAALSKATAAFHRFATVLDGQLAERKWLAGAELTLADTSIAAALTYAAPAAMPLEG